MARFYARRLRRLLPALLAMMTLTTAAAAWLLSRDEAQAMLASTPFAASWTSNLYFAWRTLDYFDELGTRDLFLHTWSLGVEEQFYLLWPPLLAAMLWLAARGARPVMLLGGLTLVGALACVTWTHLAPLQAFYQMPARIWQFALGATVYFAFDRAGVRLDRRHSALALGCGLVLILASAVFFDGTTAYPGIHALAPSAGAAAIIAGGVAASRNPLADPRLVWIGDRSYSLYLWHWPALTLGATLGFDHHFGQTLVLLLIALMLAVLSYRLVELPFWRGRFSRVAPRPVLLGGVLVITIAFAGSLHALWTPSHLERPARDPIVDMRRDMPLIYRMGCDSFVFSAELFPCVFGEKEASRTAVFIGDSIGAQWFSAFPTLFPPPQWRVVVLTKSACPIVDEDIFYKRIGGIFEICSRWRADAIDAIVAQEPEAVIIGSGNGSALDATQWIEGSRRILARLSPHVGQILVLAGTPHLGMDGPGCLARAREQKRFPLIEACRGKRDTEKAARIAGHLREAARGLPNVTVFDPAPLVCPDGRCSAITAHGVPVFRDNQHLTDRFVRASAAELRTALEGVMALD